MEVLTCEDVHVPVQEVTTCSKAEDGPCKRECLLDLKGKSKTQLHYMGSKSRERHIEFSRIRLRQLAGKKRAERKQSKSIY